MVKGLLTNIAIKKILLFQRLFGKLDSDSLMNNPVQNSIGNRLFPMISYRSFTGVCEVVTVVFLTLLQNGKQVKYTYKEGKVRVTLPQGLKNEALTFSYKIKK